MNWLGFGFRLGLESREIFHMVCGVVAGIRAVKIFIFIGDSETSNEVGYHRSDRFAGWYNLYKGLP